MEPALDERGDGSRDASLVSCGDVASCERLPAVPSRSRFSMEFSSNNTAPEQDASTYAETCVRLGARAIT